MSRSNPWRIWPQGREDRMLDKQMYRNFETVDDAALAQVKTAYEQVADMVGAFPVMRPGMVALFAESMELAPQLNAVGQALGQLGLPVLRHVASAVKTPGYVLQLLQQHDVPKRVTFGSTATAFRSRDTPYCPYVSR